MNFCLVIPAYNEEQRLKTVLRKLADLNLSVVVVDDGSSDNTYQTASDWPVNLLRHHTNRGQGAALRTGTEFAFQEGYDAVVHFDADGQHRPEDALRLIEVLNQGHDAVIGSRFMGLESVMPAKKKIIYFFAKIFSRHLLKLNFTDPQNGLRAINLRAWDKLNWRKDNFEHCSEILSLIIKHDLKYREVPIKIEYSEDTQSKNTRPGVSMAWKLLLSRMFD